MTDRAASFDYFRNRLIGANNRLLVTNLVSNIDRFKNFKIYFNGTLREMLAKQPR